MTDVTLDAGGLIALDWDDRRMVVVLMARARETAARVVVSATALAQAIRRPDRQVRLVQLVRPRGHLRAPCLGSPWSSVRLGLTRFRDAAGQQFHRQPRLPLDQLHDRWRHRRADAGVVGDCGHWKGTASPKVPLARFINVSTHCVPGRAISPHTKVIRPQAKGMHGYSK